MNKKYEKLFAYIMILGAVYYLLAEFITVSTSMESFRSYFTRTISDLGVPFRVDPFSRNAELMTSAFMLNGLAFFTCYYYLFENCLGNKKYLLTGFAFLASIGVIMVGLFNCKCSYISLHFMGTFLTFCFGNLLLIFTGKLSRSKNKFYGKFCITMGSIGIASATILLTKIPFKFVPILERMTIYPLVAFQIITGIFVLKQLNTSKNVYNKI